MTKHSKAILTGTLAGLSVLTLAVSPASAHNHAQLTAQARPSRSTPQPRLTPAQMNQQMMQNMEQMNQMMKRCNTMMSKMMNSGNSSGMMNGQTNQSGQPGR